jgi:hypothetical protein
VFHDPFLIQIDNARAVFFLIKLQIVDIFTAHNLIACCGVFSKREAHKVNKMRPRVYASFKVSEKQC